MNYRFLIAAAMASTATLAVVPATAHVAAAAAASTPVPKDQLLKPPADAAHYVVVSDAGKHGDQWRWTLPDGSTAYRYSQELRGWITEVDQVVALGGDGMPTAMTIRGVSFSGDAAETFSVKDGMANWTSSTDSGSGPAGGYYYPVGGITRFKGV